jgi:uncharacterized protein (DUF1778 family)
MSDKPAPRELRLTLRLPRDLKRTIEKAALQSGQSVGKFAVATLARAAKEVVEQQTVTRLSSRDRDRFCALLDDADARPNPALVAAARKYRARRGRMP